MKSKATRVNKWFIIISILVIISMVCGFATMLRGPQLEDTDINLTSPTITVSPSRTPQPAKTATPTATPVASGMIIPYTS